MNRVQENEGAIELDFQNFQNFQDFPGGWLFLADVLAWLILHLGISLGLMKVPDRYFNQDSFWTAIRSWEKNGEFWNKTLKVKRWKEHLPDGGTYVRHAFAKKRLRQTDSGYLDKFVLESRRAEINHLLLLLSSLLFFLWNPPWASWLMVLYALLANLPCLIAQRYNRPRLMRLAARKEKQTDLQKNADQQEKI